MTRLLLLALLVGCGSPEDDRPRRKKKNVEEPVGLDTVCLNELMPHPEAGTEAPIGRNDWLELAGEPGTPLDDWWILWGADNRFELAGHRLDETGFLVLLANDNGIVVETLPFRLSAEGESVGLEAPNGDQEWVSWGPTAGDLAHARGTDCCLEADCWTTVWNGTPGATNSPPTDTGSTTSPR